MSKRLVAVLAAIVWAGTLAFSAAMPAEEEGEQLKGIEVPEAEKTRPKSQRRTPSERKLEALLKSLEASEQTQQQVREALGEYKRDSINWRKEHQGQQRTLSKQLAEARQAKNAEAVKEIQHKMRALNESRGQLKAKSLSRLSETLDEKQMAKVKRYLGVDRPRRQPGPTARVMAQLRKLELTGEQREKAGAILQEAYLEAMARALGKVKAEVLTDEQAGKLNVDKVVQELRGKPGKPRATKHRGQVEGRPEGKRKKVEAEGKEAL